MKRFKLINKEIIGKGWSSLTRYTYDFLTDEGQWQRQVREAYDRGNGMTVLLHNPLTNKVILTRQFRLPPFLNEHPDGLMIEACAGTLENENPEEGMIREIEEETGYRVSKLRKLFEVYMSPGSVTEYLHFFMAEYDETMKVSSGGGLDHEQENIEVMELDFPEALKMISSGEIRDAKTIMLLQHLALQQASASG